MQNYSAERKGHLIFGKRIRVSAVTFTKNVFPWGFNSVIQHRAFKFTHSEKNLTCIVLVTAMSGEIINYLNTKHVLEMLLTAVINKKQLVFHQ